MLFVTYAPGVLVFPAFLRFGTGGNKPGPRAPGPDP